MKERYEDAIERIREILKERSVERPYRDYFRSEAAYLLALDPYARALAEQDALGQEIGFLQELQTVYRDMTEEAYEKSYLNPAYACETLAEYGSVLSALSLELRGAVVDLFEGRTDRLIALLELFLEIYCMFEVDNEDIPTERAIRDAFYSYCYDYSEELQEDQFREFYTGEHTLLKRVLLKCDLQDPSYLYRTGEYVSKENLETAAFIASLSEEEIDRMAYTWYFGFREGFRLQGKPYEKKKLISFRFPVGFERVVKRCSAYFREDGYDFSVPRGARHCLTRAPRGAGGYYSSPNRQMDFDHAYDLSLLMGDRIATRLIEEKRTLFKRYEGLGVSDYAGPVVMESFGEKDFTPVTKPESLQFSAHQSAVYGEYRNKLQLLTHEFIHEEERSFTIIAWPVPEIGTDFPEIFRETIRVNTMDARLYGEVQQKLIDTLDRAQYVRVSGKTNETDIRVQLHSLANPEKETNFENCLSDVNIPLGEVFTSPVLAGTEGLLHVNSVFIEGIQFKELRIWFRDGRVADYSCENFPDPEEGKRLIRKQIFGEKENLPLGEFAIGTNTTAYAMIQKYGIGAKMPILIAEKTGPHFAVGDTCYSFMEDMHLYNPDGKEIMAKENACSAVRKEHPEQAYFAVHTDITIPYHELGDITAVTETGEEIRIIRDGRFVLPGTEVLNEAL